METKYSYHASAQWHQPDHGFVELEHGAPRLINFSAPPEFGGEPGFWTPEHFLLTAVASCFVATFRAVASASKLDFEGIEVAVDGVIEKEAGGFRFTKVSLKPVAIIFTEPERERAQRLLEKAEKACLVTRSLSCSVELEPKILVEKPVTV
ncbi:MAG: OsmC family protein [Terriglobales bacterium]